MTSTKRSICFRTWFDKSLVLVEDQGGVARYRLLETIRQYAWNKLKEAGEMAQMRSRHRDWYLQIAERALVGLVGEEQDVWLDPPETEHDNIRAGLDWSTRGECNAEAALLMSSGVWRFWDTRGYITEGRRWLMRPLVEGEATARRPRQSLERCRQPGVRARGLQQGACAAHGSAGSRRRGTGDKRAEGSSLANLGVLARHRGDYEESRQLYEESLKLFSEVGSASGVASVLNSLGFFGAEPERLRTGRGAI